MPGPGLARQGIPKKRKAFYDQQQRHRDYEAYLKKECEMICRDMGGPPATEGEARTFLNKWRDAIIAAYGWAKC